MNNAMVQGKADTAAALRNRRLPATEIQNISRRDSAIISQVRR
jgi:hypothetical protein